MPNLALVFDGEEFFHIEESEGCYAISKSGRVLSLARPWVPYDRLVRPHEGRYQTVRLSVDGHGRTRTVHRLMADTFLGPRPDGMEVAHNDGNPLNNELRNLRYATRQENEHDKVAHGTVARGSRNGKAELTEREVRALKRLAASGVARANLMHAFGVREKCLKSILSGRTWAHVQ